jgi:histone acetyltransferase 1
LEDDTLKNQKKRRVVGFALPTTDVEQEPTPYLREKKKVMEMEDITKKLQLALPPIVHTTTINHEDNSTNTNKDSALDFASTSNYRYGNDDDYLLHPLGVIQKEYQRQYFNETQQRNFTLCITEEVTDEVAQYHNQVQPLALFFIETANCVDVADRNNGFWKVLYVFEKQTWDSSCTTTADTYSNQETTTTTGSNTTAFRYALVGYMTLFYFYSPFRKPSPGYIVRICQILILPHHQRVGHGLEMLRSLYQYVDDGVVEINVEDPSPAFARLRNRMDYETIRQNICDKSNTNTDHRELPRQQDQNTTSVLPIKYTKAPNITSLEEPSSVFLTLTEGDCMKAGQVAKITPHQIYISYEIYKLSILEEKLKEIHDNDTKQKWEKEYRLMVKRRLMRTHKEELGGLRTKEEKQQMLENSFQDLLKDYRSLLGIK